MKFLFGFEHKRKTGGAIAFFLVWVVISFVILLASGYLIGSISTPETAQTRGIIIGKIIGVGIPTFLAFFILKGKNLFKDTVSLIAGVLTFVIAYFFGLILAFLPVAFLTTREPKKK